MAEKKDFEMAMVFGAIAFLMIACVMIMMPFFSALLWAAILVFVTRKPYALFNKKIGGRPWLTASLFVLLLILIIILPIIFGALSFSQDVVSLVTVIRTQIDSGVFKLPEWIIQAPFVGEKISGWWNKLIANDPAVQEQINTLTAWSAKHFISIGLATLTNIGLLLLSCVAAVFFYVGHLEITTLLKSAMERISGSRAEKLLDVAGNTVHGVVVGILGTAAAQGLLTGIGLFIAGVPGALGLTLVSILLSLLPAGAALVWIPSAFWLYHHGNITMTWFIVIWGMLIVGTADNIVKPLLIGKNTDLPFLLIVLGVLGGALNWGILGVFLGPVFVALGYALLREWLLNESLSRMQEKTLSEPT